jgi:hypothetical protein
MSFLQHRDDGKLTAVCGPVFAMAEIGLLITLTSADNEVTKLAAHGLRMIAHAERQHEGTENARSGEDTSKRNLIYEQLGDPNVTIIGGFGSHLSDLVH